MITIYPITRPGSLQGVPDDVEAGDVSARHHEPGGTNGYRLLFETADAGMLLATPDGAVLEANPEACRLLGRTREEILAGGLDRVFDASSPRLAPAVERRREYRGELRLLRGDGSSFPVEASLAGDEDLIAVVFREVGGSAEGRFGGAEVHLRAVAANLPVVLFALDREGVFTLSEGRGLEALGLEPSQVIGRSAFEMYREAPQIVEDVRRALSGEEFSAISEMDGLTFEVWYSPLRGEVGEVAGVIGVAADITERKRAEEALRDSEERFRITFEGAAVGIAHVNAHGRWVRVNQKLCEIVGYDKEELSGLTFQDITHPEDLDKDFHHVQRMLKGEIKNYSIEKRYVRKDGSRIWACLSVSLVRGLSGEPEYFISVVDEITERKLKELIPDPLTSRELEVLRLLILRRTNEEISQRLNYSVGTVKRHVGDIISKLGVRNRREAAVRAVEIGLLPPPS